MPPLSSLALKGGRSGACGGAAGAGMASMETGDGYRGGRGRSGGYQSRGGGGRGGGYNSGGRSGAGRGGYNDGSYYTSGGGGGGGGGRGYNQNFSQGGRGRGRGYWGGRGAGSWAVIVALLKRCYIASWHIDIDCNYLAGRILRRRRVCCMGRCIAGACTLLPAPCCRLLLFNLPACPPSSRRARPGAVQRPR